MSLSKYQIFLRTVECGSFTKAAESMSFTQSGVSHAVQSLEDELGVCLLSRSRGGVTLTADGRALSRGAALAALDIVREPAERLETAPRARAADIPPPELEVYLAEGVEDERRNRVAA